MSRASTGQDVRGLSVGSSVQQSRQWVGRVWPEWKEPAKLMQTLVQQSEEEYV